MMERERKNCELEDECTHILSPTAARRKLIRAGVNAPRLSSFLADDADNVSSVLTPRFNKITSGRAFEEQAEPKLCRGCEPRCFALISAAIKARAL